MELGEGIRKLILAGIGTLAVSHEKSSEIFEELVRKGELTIDQGRVLNEELKHEIVHQEEPDILAHMSDDELAELEKRIAELKNQRAGKEEKE